MAYVGQIVRFSVYTLMALNSLPHPILVRDLIRHFSRVAPLTTSLAASPPNLIFRMLSISHNIYILFHKLIQH